MKRSLAGILGLKKTASANVEEEAVIEEEVVETEVETPALEVEEEEEIVDENLENVEEAEASELVKAQKTISNLQAQLKAANGKLAIAQGKAAKWDAYQESAAEAGVGVNDSSQAEVEKSDDDMTIEELKAKHKYFN